MISGNLSCEIAAILAEETFACHAVLSTGSYPMLATPKDKSFWASRSRFCSFFGSSLLRSLLDLQAVGSQESGKHKVDHPSQSSSSCELRYGLINEMMQNAASAYHIGCKGSKAQELTRRVFAMTPSKCLTQQWHSSSMHLSPATRKVTEVQCPNKLVQRT